VRAKDGADDRIRTCDPRITNAVLYQLSYISIFHQARLTLLLAIMPKDKKKGDFPMITA
jgi:hypothetical protein